MYRNGTSSQNAEQRVQQMGNTARDFREKNKTQYRKIRTSETAPAAGWMVAVVIFVLALILALTVTLVLVLLNNRNLSSGTERAETEEPSVTVALPKPEGESKKMNIVLNDGIAEVDTIVDGYDTYISISGIVSGLSGFNILEAPGIVNITRPSDNENIKGTVEFKCGETHAELTVKRTVDSKDSETIKTSTAELKKAPFRSKDDVYVYIRDLETLLGAAVGYDAVTDMTRIYLREINADKALAVQST